MLLTQQSNYHITSFEDRRKNLVQTLSHRVGDLENTIRDISEIESVLPTLKRMESEAGIKSYEVSELEKIRIDKMALRDELEPNVKELKSRIEIVEVALQAFALIRKTKGK